MLPFAHELLIDGSPLRIYVTAELMDAGKKPFKGLVGCTFCSHYDYFKVCP